MTKFRWELKPFEELSTNDLFAIFETRQAIFIIEQTCIYPDIDDLDKQAWHLTAWDESGEIAAYARILAPGVRYAQAAIGRVLITQAMRGKGLANELMHRAIEFVDGKYPKQAIKIGAQLYLEKFYLQLGFTTVSDPYDEDGIMHIDMVRK